MQCNYLSSNSFDPAFLQEHTSNGYLGKRDDQISRQFARERFNRHVDAGMRIVGRDSVAFLCTTGNLNDWYNVTGVIYQESIASVNHALSLSLFLPEYQVRLGKIGSSEDVDTFDSCEYWFPAWLIFDNTSRFLG